MSRKAKHFKKTVYSYYRKERRNFPWRPPAERLRKDGTLNPYHVLVSETMLQQTQVCRVISRYEAFLKTFPTIRTLADASLRDALFLWQGLGYNRRARMLKEAAEIIVQRHNGDIPRSKEDLVALPGIGENTAGAIFAFAFNKPACFIETNIRTVFIYFFFRNRQKIQDKEILSYVEKTIDYSNPREWYYALMDYGAMLKKEYGNINVQSAHYNKQSAFEGSDRQIRSAILKTLLKQKRLPEDSLVKILQIDHKRVRAQVHALEEERFLKCEGGYLFVV